MEDQTKAGMDRRIRTLAVVFLAAMALVMGCLFGTMRTTERYNKVVAGQQAELDEIHRAEQKLDERGVRIDRMARYYSDHESVFDGGLSLVNTDAEFREYCRENYPEAVYPTSEWTADEVIQSYHDNHEKMWGLWRDGYYESFYFCWTPGYEHCFILDTGYVFPEEEYGELGSGWLVVDGVKVQPFGESILLMDPELLLQAYQSGKWDGNSAMSPDWSTTAYVDSKGNLAYYYSACCYDATIDPDGLAYTGYEEPWWVGDVKPEIAKLLVEPEYYPLEEATDYASGSVDVNLNVDFPKDYDFEEVFLTRRFGGQSFCLKPTGVTLAERGKILNEWQLELNRGTLIELLAPAKEPEAEYARDVAYVYDGDRLWALVEDGTLRLVIEKTAELDQGVSDVGFDLWGMNGKKLIHWDGRQYYSVKQSPEVIAENVEGVYFNTLRLIVKEDGCYAILRDYHSDVVEYPVEYLGAETPEYYEKQYQTMSEAKIYRW